MYRVIVRAGGEVISSTVYRRKRDAQRVFDRYTALGCQCKIVHDTGVWDA